MLNWFYERPRKEKRIWMMMFDACALVLALWMAFSLRLGEVFVPAWTPWWVFLMPPVIAIPIFKKMGLYRAVIHLIEVQALGTMIRAVSLMVVVFALLLLLLAPHGVPRSSMVIFWMVSLLVIGGSRFWLRRLLQSSQKKDTASVVIYGAGETGARLASSLLLSGQARVVAFLDDNPDLQGQEVAGIRVHAAEDMDELVEQMGVEQVLIAIPSASMLQKKKIFHALEELPVQVRILPDLDDMHHGTVQLNRLRDISVEDLLGRDAVAPNVELLGRNITGKVVMVTGAGGSIGSEICRQVLKQKPDSLLLFEQSEFALYSIKRELKAQSHEKVNIIPLLGSVTHQHRVEHVCRVFGVHTIYHAAAYKHVPLVEYNPIEGVQNNALGTWRTAKAAMTAGVETFVLISTDKAVRPTNVMGATKRLAELGLQALASTKPNTRFCMVRFGNVLGSSGSVVPLFSKQIQDGGPVTVTHPEITRYFMTIPEASQLVIQAGAMGQGGDVFVLDMGEPVRIMDLAEKMIRLSGLTVKSPENPNGDIEIQCTGLRPGEKLYEELLIGEHVSGTDHPLIMRAEEDMLSMEAIDALEKALMAAAQQFDVERLRELLLSTVSGYHPQCELQDLVYMRGKISV